MSVELRDKHIMRLWSLALEGGGDWNKAMSPKLDAKDRALLKSAGLIDVANRPPDGGGRAAMYLELTDRGWATLSDRMGQPIDKRVSAAAAFGKLLARLREFLERERLSLAEFIGRSDLSPDAEPESSEEHAQIRLEFEDPMPALGPPHELDRKIVDAYHKLAGGREDVRIRLADLRDALPEVSRKSLDAGLEKLALEGRASLFELNNPYEINDRDRDAVLLTPTGQRRHLIYLGGGAR